MVDHGLPDLTLQVHFNPRFQLIHWHGVCIPSGRMVEDRAKKWEGPIFILADEDQPASDRIVSLLYPELFVIVPVTNPRHVLSYAKRLKPHASFLADPIEFQKGGAAALLERLIDEEGAPVIVLAELWAPEVAERWKRLGAAGCLPHPTRVDQRLELVRSRMQDIALASVPREILTGSPRNGRGD